MIYTKLSDAKIYEKMHPLFKKAFEELKKYGPNDFKYDSLEIQGDDIVFNFNEYETSDSDRYEDHGTYIDIQYMVEGHEVIKVINKKDALLQKEYVKEDDVAWYLPKENVASFEMFPGDILILFPDDPHNPGLPYKKSENVKKIVAKVKF